MVNEVIIYTQYSIYIYICFKSHTQVYDIQ